jgi:hypothetical protein
MRRETGGRGLRACDKEVKARGTDNLGVSGDRRGEGNVEEIVVYRGKDGGIVDSREIDVKILDVETVERFDATARNIDEDRFVGARRRTKCNTDFGFRLSESDLLLFFGRGHRATKRELETCGDVGDNIGDQLQRRHVTGHGRGIRCLNPGLYSIRPE